ncbi:MAG TPA: hypothetical protein VOA87_00105 [Thermoanaerobaculia bacterium]|nr:hypothetical protein [Thermoanaerobaculia bacterium]
MPAPRVDVALAPARVTVGDPVTAVVTLRLPTTRGAELAGEPRFPAWGASWGEAEIRRHDPPRKVAEQGGVATYEQQLVLIPWKPGRIALPPAVVAIPLRTRTVAAATPAALAFSVASVLPPAGRDGKEPEPKPEAPLRPLPLGSRFWWTAAALAACCAAAGLLLWRRSRRTAEAAAAPLLPPLAELLARLDRLAAEGSALQLHVGLSLALRGYLGRALDFPAAESTTSEINRRLLARRLPAPLVRRAIELLRGCDLVKFARQEVGVERSRERIGAAREIAGEIERWAAPAPLETAAPQALERAG